MKAADLERKNAILDMRLGNRKGAQAVGAAASKEEKVYTLLVLRRDVDLYVLQAATLRDRLDSLTAEYAAMKESYVSRSSCA